MLRMITQFFNRLTNKGSTPIVVAKKSIFSSARAFLAALPFVVVPPID